MSERGLAWALGLLLSFCALAKAGHDAWAATAAQLAALSLAGACLWRSSPRRGGAVSAAFLAPMGLWALALALSFRGAANPAESFLRLRDCLAAMLVFWTTLHALREDGPARVLEGVLAALFCVEAAVIFSQRAAAPWGQVPGTMVNANAAAAFHLLWLPVLLDRARASWDGPRRWAWAAGAASCAASLLLLDSAWAVVTLALGLPWLLGPEALLRWARRRPRQAAGGALALAAGLAALVLWKAGQAGEWRFLWWKSGLAMLAVRPWLGVGLGNFPSAYLAFQAGAGQHTLSPHSIPVLLAAETGVLGLAGASACLALWGRRLLRRWDVLRARWPYALGALLFLVYGLVSLGLEYLANLLGLSIALAAAVAPSVKPGLRPRWSALAALAGGGIAVIPYILSPWQADRACVSARDSLEKGEVAAALRGFSAAAELDPLSWEARQGLAAALWARSGGKDAASLEAAVAAQGEAVSRNLLSGALRWELGFLLEAAGRPGEALEAYEDAMRLRDPGPRARRDRDRIAARLGPWKGATP